MNHTTLCYLLSTMPASGPVLRPRSKGKARTNLSSKNVPSVAPEALLSRKRKKTPARRKPPKQPKSEPAPSMEGSSAATRKVQTTLEKHSAEPPPVVKREGDKRSFQEQPLQAERKPEESEKNASKVAAYVLCSDFC